VIIVSGITIVTIRHKRDSALYVFKFEMPRIFESDSTLVFRSHCACNREIHRKQNIDYFACNNCNDNRTFSKVPNFSSYLALLLISPMATFPPIRSDNLSRHCCYRLAGISKMSQIVDRSTSLSRNRRGSSRHSRERT